MSHDQRTEPIRVGVIGLGYWGPNIVRALHEVEGAQVAAICDRRQPVLDKLGARFPSPRRTTDANSILDDDEIDAVVIATPVATHFGLASRALAAGKHTFVEKPMAGSTTEAIQLEETATARSLVLMPGHTFVYSPPVRKVREMLASGTIGDVQFITSSRVNLGLHQSDVSVVWDLGPHDLSILRYWLDESPVRVSAVARSCVMAGISDVAFINLEYASGVVAHVELSWLAPSKLRRTVLVGSERMIVYDDTNTEPVRLFDSGVDLPSPQTFGDYKLTYRVGDIVSPRVVAAEPLGVEMQDFLGAIRGGGEPVSSARMGVEIVQVIEAIETAIATGERVDVISTPEPAVASSGPH